MTYPLDGTTIKEQGNPVLQMRTALILYHRDGAMIVQISKGKTVVVGRAPPSDVVIAELGLSRQHARFTWGDDGGHRTARILSVIATAISHDVNPRAYLHLVARRIVDGWPQSRLRDLLPDRMLHEHPELFVGDDQELAAVTSAALAAPSELQPAR